MNTTPGHRKTIALLPGDGVGAEVIAAAQAVLETIGGDTLRFVEAEIGWGVFERTGHALPPATLDLVRETDGALLGAVQSPSHPVDGYRSPVVALRRELDLYANLRPVRAAVGHGLSGRAVDGLDLLIVRENTEGLYCGRERMDDGDTAIAERVITRAASTRIAHIALRAARERRKKLTIAHEANILRMTDGLFRDAVLRAAESYPDVEVEEQLIDALLYRLISNPLDFDVIVAPNLYGDVASDAAAALGGGLGLAPSMNTDGTRVVAEPVHGSAPDIAGRGIANPIATLRAAVMLLDALGRPGDGRTLEKAVDRVLARGPRTPDLGGSAGTTDVARAVIREVRRSRE